MNQEHIIVLNVNAPINRASKYVKPKLTGLKGETKSTIRGGDFNILFFVIDRTGRKKVLKTWTI